MRLVSCLIVLFLSTSVYAQNLNGLWKGSLQMSGCFAVNNIELQLFQSNGRITGDCYHYESLDFYVKKKVSGRYDNSTRQLLVNEDYVTTFHIPSTCSICVKNFYLVYSIEGKIETLRGRWDGQVLNTGQPCSGGSITLSRIKESAFKDIPEVLVDTGTVRLDFYDNAIVDGDSITVLLDKNVIATHQRLSTKPITVYITIDLYHPFHEIEMVAENLGTIPPNTAVLIITAGSRRYQLFLSSTKTKSAMVRFVYDRKEGP